MSFRGPKISLRPSCPRFGNCWAGSKPRAGSSWSAEMWTGPTNVSSGWRRGRGSSFSITPWPGPTVGDRRLAIAGLELGFFSRDARGCLGPVGKLRGSGRDSNRTVAPAGCGPGVARAYADRPGRGRPHTWRTGGGAWLRAADDALTSAPFGRGGGAAPPGRGVDLRQPWRRLRSGQAPVLRFMCPPEISLIELRGQTAGADESG